MAIPNTVKVLEVCRVAPPPGSVTQTSLPLTFVDLCGLPMPPPQFLYFYDFPHSKSHFIDSLLPSVKHSLSVTLQYFYPLAGNLVWLLESEKPMMNYVDGDSVSLTVAESEDDFYHLSSNNEKDATKSYSLVPHLPVTGELVPIMALQVTLFPNYGICIGMSFHHGAIDGKIATRFMKSWASVCRLEDTSLLMEALPFYDKTVLKDPSGLEPVLLNDLVNFLHSESESESKYRKLKVRDLGHPLNMVRATFEINQANVAKLKELVLTQCNNGEHRPPFHISTFMVASAYVWMCLLKAGEEEASGNNVVFMIPADCRSRVDPPIPSNYFGNCIWCIIVMAKKNDIMGQDGIVMATKSIREGIKRLDDGIFSGLFCGTKETISFFLANPQRLHGVSGSPRFGVYETNFGWGNPKKVEMVSFRPGGVSFLESRKGDGGIEISLVLNKSKMETFASVFINGLNAL